MRYSSLFICAISFLFFDFSCEDYCEAGSNELNVVLDGPAQQLSVGDTLWLSASFNARLNGATITEDGGNMLTYVLAVDTTSGGVTAGRNSFDLIAPLGNIRENRNGLEEPAGIYWTYACPEEDCGFNIGLIARNTGTFLLDTYGLGYSVETISSDCRVEDYAFYFTSMVPTPDISNSTLDSPFPSYTHQLTAVNQSYFISASSSNNFLFTVEE